MSSFRMWFYCLNSTWSYRIIWETCHSFPHIWKIMDYCQFFLKILREFISISIWAWKRKKRGEEKDRQEKRGEGRRNIVWVESTVSHVKRSNFLFLNQSRYVLSFRNYFFNEVISRTYLFLGFLYKPLHFCNKSSDVLFSMLT